MTFIFAIFTCTQVIARRFGYNKNYTATTMNKSSRVWVFISNQLFHLSENSSVHIWATLIKSNQSVRGKIVIRTLLEHYWYYFICLSISKSDQSVRGKIVIRTLLEHHWYYFICLSISKKEESETCKPTFSVGGWQLMECKIHLSFLAIVLLSGKPELSASLTISFYTCNKETFCSDQSRWNLAI